MSTQETRSVLFLSLTWEGHRVRMAGTPERPEWIAKDVCRVLHIHNASDALIKAGVRADEKGIARIYTPGGPQDVTTILESGLWKLVIASRKPSAQHFKHWLASEVLPSIRRHGCYPPPAEQTFIALPDLDDPTALRGLCLALTERRLADQALIAELKPKAESHDRLQAARGAVCLMTAGRILGRQPRKLIELLEAEQILVRCDRGKLLPAHSYRLEGYFVVREKIVDRDSYPQTLVTNRGLQWLAKRYPATDKPGDERGALPCREGRPYLTTVGVGSAGGLPVGR